MSNEAIKGILKRLTHLEKLVRALQSHGEHAENNDEAKDRLSAAKLTNVPQSESPSVRLAQPEWHLYSCTPKWKTWLESVGIVFAIGYAIVTGLQWWGLRQNFKVDQRAWVIDTEILPSSRDSSGTAVWFQIGQKPAFGIKFANSGKSPAVAVEARFTSKLFPKLAPFYPIYDQTNTPPSSLTLPPGGTAEIDSDPKDPITVEITNELAAAVKSGNQIVRVYGEITYTDIFRDLHRTTFCMYLASDLRAFKRCNSYNIAN